MITVTQQAKSRILKRLDSIRYQHASLNLTRDDIETSGAILIITRQKGTKETKEQYLASLHYLCLGLFLFPTT